MRPVLFPNQWRTRLYHILPLTMPPTQPLDVPPPIRVYVRTMNLAGRPYPPPFPPGTPPDALHYDAPGPVTMPVRVGAHVELYGLALNRSHKASGGELDAQRSYTARPLGIEGQVDRVLALTHDAVSLLLPNRGSHPTPQIVLRVPNIPGVTVDLRVEDTRTAWPAHVTHRPIVYEPDMQLRNRRSHYPYSLRTFETGLGYKRMDPPRKKPPKRGAQDPYPLTRARAMHTAGESREEDVGPHDILSSNTSCADIDTEHGECPQLQSQSVHNMSMTKGHCNGDLEVSSLSYFLQRCRLTHPRCCYLSRFNLQQHQVVTRGRAHNMVRFDRLQRA